MSEELAYSGKVLSFVDVLEKELPDLRDNRGKRHSLTFIIVAFVLATLCGRQQLSGVHRFIINKIDWLREIMKMPDAQVISRAHLPRLLNKVNWIALDKIITLCFDVKIEKSGHVIKPVQVLEQEESELSDKTLCESEKIVQTLSSNGDQKNMGKC
jgi:hypothetical protein